MKKLLYIKVKNGKTTKIKVNVDKEMNIHMDGDRSFELYKIKEPSRKLESWEKDIVTGYNQYPRIN